MSTSPQSPPVPDPATEPSPTRRRIEQASVPALTALAKLPVWLPFLLLLLLILGGGFLGGFLGWALVTVALLFVFWLLYLSWPRLAPVERVMRVAILLLFLVVAITQLLPRG